MTQKSDTHDEELSSRFYIYFTVRLIQQSNQFDSL